MPLARKWVSLIVLGILGLGAASFSQDSPAPVLQFLHQTIDWYRGLVMEQQVATEPRDLAFVHAHREVANQVVRLAFEFARVQAESLAKQNAAATDNAD